MFKTGRPTSSNVQQANVVAGHTLFIDSYIWAMPSLPAICGIMQRLAGVRRLLKRQMAHGTSKPHAHHYKT
jgi:hypothetical protein